MSNGASSQVVANAIFHRMSVFFPKELVGADIRVDEFALAVEEVAENHAGCEELGSSDISIMVREVVQKLVGN